MAPPRIDDLMEEVLASPLGDIIASVGEGVAEAQRALDEGSIATTLRIYQEGGDELYKTLREIGYQPTFYTLPETTGEVNISLRLSGSSGSGANTPSRRTAQPVLPATTRAAALSAGHIRALKPAARVRPYATPVDAGFANKYNYSATAAAKLTFKIVPVPPPAGMDEMRPVPRTRQPGKRDANDGRGGQRRARRAGA